MVARFNPGSMDGQQDGEWPRAATTTDELIEASLSDWDGFIIDWSIARQDVADARQEVARLTLTLERIRAAHFLCITGGNAQTRKARLTLALADDARYQAHLGVLHATRAELAEAERQAGIARERCKMLAADVACMRAAR
jgi:hypothetical protein